jgi:hypothetical protein
MGSEKPKAVIRLFDEIRASTVVLADTDTIWLRDPFPFLDQHPQADIFVTTDCLSHEAEVHSSVNLPRCGHVEGSHGGWALNTGAFPTIMFLPTASNTTSCFVLPCCGCTASLEGFD